LPVFKRYVSYCSATEPPLKTCSTIVGGSASLFRKLVRDHKKLAKKHRDWNETLLLSQILHLKGNSASSMTELLDYEKLFASGVFTLRIRHRTSKK